jgi:hypothetical protein
MFIRLDPQGVETKLDVSCSYSWNDLWIDYSFSLSAS